jgi:hypothetical protein
MPLRLVFLLIPKGAHCNRGPCGNRCGGVRDPPSLLPRRRIPSLGGIKRGEPGRITLRSRYMLSISDTQPGAPGTGLPLYPEVIRGCLMSVTRCSFSAAPHLARPRGGCPGRRAIGASSKPGGEAESSPAAAGAVPLPGGGACVAPAGTSDLTDPVAQARHVHRETAHFTCCFKFDSRYHGLMTQVMMRYGSARPRTLLARVGGPRPRLSRYGLTHKVNSGPGTDLALKEGAPA